MLISVNLLTKYVINKIRHLVRYMKSSASESKPFQRRNSRPGQAKRTPEPFQIETGIPNWFRRRTFHVLNSTLVQWIRFGTWKVRRLLISYGGEYRWSSEKRKETTLLFFYVKAVILVIKSIFQENRNYHGKVVLLRQVYTGLCISSHLSYQKHLSRKQKLPRQGGLTETSLHWCTTQMQPTNIERESIFLPFFLKTTKVVRHT